MNKLIWLLVCFFSITVSAQEKLVVMGAAPNMYVVYPTNGTESLQNISNQFGLSVAKLSAYNNININTSAAFAKGTEIKIPFTKDNLLQHSNESSAPLYHVIRQGDNLYRLSLAYNKVPIPVLREWNNMKNDIVKDGQLIMIGYLVNGKPVEKKTDTKKDVITTLPNKTQSSDIATAAVAKNTPTTTITTPEIKDNKPAEIKHTAPDVKQKENTETAPVIKEPVVLKTPAEAKDTKTTIVTEAKKKDESTEYVPKEGDEGYFAAGYAEHTRDQLAQFHSGDAATFKTISGWTDRKFYVLMNDVAPKTILRITAPNNKSICAMVLGPLQETRGAGGLLLRMSNSAANALGILDPKATVTVTYFE